MQGPQRPGYPTADGVMALVVKFSEDEFNFRISKITLKTASTATLLSSLTAELKKVMLLFYWAPWQRLSLRDNLRDNPPLCGQKVSDSRTTWQGCRGRGVGHLGPGTFLLWASVFPTSKWENPVAAGCMEWLLGARPSVPQLCSFELLRPWASSVSFTWELVRSAISWVHLDLLTQTPWVRTQPSEL